MTDARRPTRPPGIVEVAARAGVSPATVSRCFNTPAMVRAPTREKIERAAEELGYIRDRRAGSLHGQMSGTVGLIVPTVDNAIFGEMIQSFSDELRRHGLSMLLATHDYDLGLEAELVRSLLEHRVDALALVGHDHDPAMLEVLARRGTPVIKLWAGGEEGPVPCIGYDNRRAGEIAMAELAALGHRRIAALFPETARNDRARARLEGVLAAAREAGIGDAGVEQVFCRYDLAEAKRVAAGLLARADPPSAFVCGNDVIAQGVLYAARSLGVAMPERLSVVGIGDFRGSAEIEPGLTTVRIPARRIGAAGAAALARLLGGQNVSGESFGLDLVRRGSTGRAPGS